MDKLSPTTVLDEIDHQARAVYEDLRAGLEAEHFGEAVAIHVPSGDYSVARTQREARQAVRSRHGSEGTVVSMTIGPPSDFDIWLSRRPLLAPKQ